jgi:(R,R)-butanediol dehydrogenase/meso-butanediol dehydrogenase/diacetyl reductase
MKAAVYKAPRQVSVEEVPTPKPGLGQVLIRVKYCAICGSDTHRYQHGVLAKGAIMGHEHCGIVAEVGKGVERWKVGDRVVCGGGTPPQGTPPPPAMLPRFSYRTYSLALQQPGGFAEYVLMDAWRPLPIPDGVPDEAACMTEPCSVAVHAVRLSGIKLCDRVTIIGAGPVGLLCLQAARAAGASQIIVSEPVPLRREVALKMGADIVIDPKSVDGVVEIVKLTNGVGPDVVFETAGAGPTLQHSLEMVRRDGMVVVAGVAWHPVPVTSGDWFGREVRMKAIYGSVPEEWQMSLDLMKAGKFDMKPMLSGNAFVPLDRIQEGFESLISPKNEIQVIVVC